MVEEFYDEFPDKDKSRIPEMVKWLVESYSESPFNIKEVLDKAAELERYWGSFPDWYWKHGLHDAEVLSISEIELNPDYKSPKPKYNCLEFCLDGESALYEQDICKVRFYNYKIKDCDVPFGKLEKLWWLNDNLTKISDKRYLSEIAFDAFKGNHKNLIITYESAEVERKQK